MRVSENLPGLQFPANIDVPLPDSEITLICTPGSIFNYMLPHLELEQVQLDELYGVLRAVKAEPFTPPCHSRMFLAGIHPYSL